MEEIKTDVESFARIRVVGVGGSGNNAVNYMAAAKVKGVEFIAINTDAHSVDDFDELRFGVLTARRGWLTAKQCINAWSKAKLHKWLKSKR